MDRNTAITRVQQGLGFRTVLSDTIALRMQEEQRDLERGKTLPKFLLVEDATLALLAGQTDVTLPADFLRRSDISLRYTPTSETNTKTIPWRDFDEAYAAISEDSDAAGPKVAILRATVVRFLPEADVNYDIEFTYYAKGLVLSTNIENVWLANAPELIIGGAGLRIAKDLRDKAAIELFGDMYKQARMTWFAETIVEEAEDGPMCLGSNA